MLVGEDDDAARRGDKRLVARSECAYYCPDAATVRRCVEALRSSDERLRARPEELMLWDWQSTFLQTDPDNEAGGGTILPDHRGRPPEPPHGVAWYDEAFYLDRRDAWFGALHKRAYATIGVPPENVTVTHWRLDSRTA